MGKTRSARQHNAMMAMPNSKQKQSLNVDQEDQKKIVVKASKNNNAQISKRTSSKKPKMGFSELVAKHQQSKHSKGQMSANEDDALEVINYTGVPVDEPRVIQSDIDRQSSGNQLIGVDRALNDLDEILPGDSIDLDVNPLDDNFNSGVEDGTEEEQDDSSSDSDDGENFDDDGSIDSEIFLNKRKRSPEPGPSKVNQTMPHQQKDRVIANLSSKDDVKSYIDQLVNERVKNELKKHYKEKNESITPKGKTGKGKGNSEMVKPPSDTTLYAPALKRGFVNDNIINKISNFVEDIRIEEDRRSGLTEWRSTDPSDHERNKTSDQRKYRENKKPPSSPVKSKDIADDIILQAEQFKAQVAAPKGRTDFISSNVQVPPEIEMLRQNDNDNDFFHITCHIDENLKLKIEKGEFIDLEKLIAKDNGTKMLTKESRVELVN